MNTIKHSVVLNDMDEKKTPDGKVKMFSIKFITLTGELVFLKRAIKTGLRMHLKNNMMRGVLPVDKEGEKTAHIYPVKIWNIIEYNGYEVSL